VASIQAQEAEENRQISVAFFLVVTDIRKKIYDNLRSEETRLLHLSKKDFDEATKALNKAHKPCATARLADAAETYVTFSAELKHLQVFVAAQSRLKTWQKVPEDKKNFKASFMQAFSDATKYTDCCEHISFDAYAIYNAEQCCKFLAEAVLGDLTGVAIGRTFVFSAVELATTDPYKHWTMETRYRYQEKYSTLVFRQGLIMALGKQTVEEKRNFLSLIFNHFFIDGSASFVRWESGTDGDKAIRSMEIMTRSVWDLVEAKPTSSGTGDLCISPAVSYCMAHKTSPLVESFFCDMNVGQKLYQEAVAHNEELKKRQAMNGKVVSFKEMLTKYKAKASKQTITKSELSKDDWGDAIDKLNDLTTGQDVEESTKKELKALFVSVLQEAYAMMFLQLTKEADNFLTKLCNPAEAWQTVSSQQWTILLSNFQTYFQDIFMYEKLNPFLKQISDDVFVEPNALCEYFSGWGAVGVGLVELMSATYHFKSFNDIAEEERFRVAIVPGEELVKQAREWIEMMVHSDRLGQLLQITEELLKGWGKVASRILGPNKDVFTKLLPETTLKVFDLMDTGITNCFLGIYAKVREQYLPALSSAEAVLKPIIAKDLLGEGPNPQDPQSQGQKDFESDIQNCLRARHITQQDFQIKVYDRVLDLAKIVDSPQAYAEIKVQVGLASFAHQLSLGIYRIKIAAPSPRISDEQMWAGFQKVRTACTATLTSGWQDMRQLIREHLASTNEDGINAQNIVEEACKYFWRHYVQRYTSGIGLQINKLWHLKPNQWLDEFQPMSLQHVQDKFFNEDYNTLAESFDSIGAPFLEFQSCSANIKQYGIKLPEAIQKDLDAKTGQIVDMGQYLASVQAVSKMLTAFVGKTLQSRKHTKVECPCCLAAGCVAS